MGRRITYTKEVELQDNEIAARKDLETGEYTDLLTRRNTVPIGKSLIQQKDFTKLNRQVVPFLMEKLSNEELSIVFKMIYMAEYNSNSLEPLSNSTTLKELSEQFNVGKNQVSKYFNNLFELGVYAQFKIAKSGLKEFWILSPYISFRGKTIEDSIFDNFRGTEIEKFINQSPRREKSSL